jgi:hypothetical protein
LNDLLGDTVARRTQSVETTRCLGYGLEHTRTAFREKAPGDAEQHALMNLLPRGGFEFVGVNVPSRIRTAAVNFQDGCANCYLIA